MLDVDNPQVRTEELMQRVREEVRRRREQKALNAHGASSAGETRIPDDWRAIDEALAVAQKYHAVGLSLPPMTRQQGIKRQLAIPIALLIRRLAQVVTRDQRAFNQASVGALGAVYESLKVQAAYAAELARQVQASQEVLAAVREEGTARATELVREIQALQEALAAVREEGATQVQEVAGQVASQAQAFERALAAVREEGTARATELVREIQALQEALAAVREEGTARVAGAQATLQSRRDIWRTTNAVLRSLDDIIPHIRFLDSVGGRFHPTFYKNWDLGLIMRFILERYDKSAPILDVGCMSNPLLFNLARIGYSNLHGIDFKLVKEGVYSHPGIRYIKADLTQTPFKDGQFACITSLSVVEHGVDAERYFSEMSRILKSGGVLLTSVDYWPQKVRTSTLPRETTYGLPWKIFSKGEVSKLVNVSQRFGFRLMEELNYSVNERVVHFLGKAYTFIAFGLEKHAS